MPGETPFILEGEVVVREGDSRIPAVVWEDFATISTAGTEAFVNGSTDSATYLTGTTLVSANVQTLPTITFPAGSGGLTVVLEPRVTANSQNWKTGIVYRVLKPGAAR